MTRMFIAATAVLIGLSAPPLQAQQDTFPRSPVTGAMLDSIEYHIRMFPGDTTVDRKMPAVAPDDFVAVDRNPVPIKQVEATYPGRHGARQYPKGTVWVRCLIRADGTVGDVVVLRADNPIFIDLAVAAVKQWLFSPATLRGKPVAVWAAIPIRVRPE